jgi:hypothetical protein
MNQRDGGGQVGGRAASARPTRTAEKRRNWPAAEIRTATLGIGPMDEHDADQLPRDPDFDPAGLEELDGERVTIPSRHRPRSARHDPSHRSATLIAGNN